MPTPEEQTAGLTARVRTFLEAKGIGNDASSEAVTAAYQSKFTGWAHNSDLNDATLGALLGAIVSANPNLVMPKSAPEPGPDFYRFMSEAKNINPEEFRLLHPMKKLQYANEFEASQTAAPIPDAVALANLQARYGEDLNAALPRMSTLDKVRFAGATKGVNDHQHERLAKNADGSVGAKLSHAPTALAAMTPMQKLSYSNTKPKVASLTQEIASLRASAPAGFNVDVSRHHLLQRREAELSALKAQFPAGVFE